MVQELQWVASAVLHFDPQYELPQKFLSDSLSAVLWLPDGSLWLGSDEAATLECLALSSPIQAMPLQFGSHRQVHLEQYLPDFQSVDEKGKPEEVDVEGLACADGYLWFVGSHSTKRKKPKVKSADLLRNPEDVLSLTKVKREYNRYLLGRIRLQPDAQGSPERSDAQALPLSDAAYLERTATGNLLTDALLDDPHLGATLQACLYRDQALAYPGKDNGFDVEGIVVRGDRIWLGLRGPVLRGWSILLEVEVKESRSGLLELKKIGPNGERYRKHFLDLRGLGIRDLCDRGGDLLILAGPTMSLDSPVYVFSLKGGLDRLTEAGTENLQVLELLGEVPVGKDGDAGLDHPEGLTLVPHSDGAQVLTVYDSPRAARKQDEGHSVTADIFELPPLR